jgi:hypothetical protein
MDDCTIFSDWLLASEKKSFTRRKRKITPVDGNLGARSVDVKLTPIKQIFFAME